MQLYLLNGKTQFLYTLDGKKQFLHPKKKTDYSQIPQAG